LPSWHFTNRPTATTPTRPCSIPRAGTWPQLYQNKGRDIGGAQTLSIDGDYDFDASVFKKLSFGVRYDDRHALHRQPRPGDTVKGVSRSA
jgi:hypothetical protein